MGKIKKPTIKERKFAIAKVKGKTNIEAYKEAGYKMVGNSAAVDASKVKSRPHVQKLIEDALEAQGLSAEWAVAQLGKVARQDDELGAKRLASKDILELHGWNKTDRPTLQLDIKNAFFANARKPDDKTRYIEAEE